MIKFGIYVDGSVLIGALNKHELKVDDFEGFYRHVFEEAVKSWSSSFFNQQPPEGCHLHRVYWYQVAGLDRIDFTDGKTQTYYRTLFDSDEIVKRLYLALASQYLKNASPQELQAEAFKVFFEERRAWYASKAAVLDAMRSFNHAIQAGCDFIEILSCGHWKVNLLHGHIVEKGLDTTFAVDVAKAGDLVDVVIIVAADYDATPAVAHVKSRGRNVGIIDIHRGAPTDVKSRPPSSKLHNLCDFVCPIYEADLVRKKIAQSRHREPRPVPIPAGAATASAARRP